MNIRKIAANEIKIRPTKRKINQAKQFLKDLGILPKANNVQAKKGGIIG